MYSDQIRFENHVKCVTFELLMKAVYKTQIWLYQRVEYVKTHQSQDDLLGVNGS